MDKIISVKLLMVLALFSHSLSTFSQTKDPVIVAIDLDAGTIGKVPFDQPFKFSSFKTVYDEITLTYTINQEYLNRKEKPDYNKGGTVKFTVNKLTGMAMCQDFIKPLHPNVIYDFKFTATKAISLSTEEETAYRKELFELITKAFKGMPDIDPNRIIIFKKNLEQILKKYAKSDKFTDAHGNVIDVKTIPLFTSDLHTPITNIEQAYYNLHTSIPLAITGEKKSAINHFTTASGNIVFFKKLTDALKNDKLISDSFKKLLDNPINPSMPTNATLTVRQYLQYMLEDPVVRIVEIIDGEKKIVGNDHDITDETDKNSLLLLQKLFEILNRSTVTNAKGNPYFSDQEKRFIALSLKELSEYIAGLNQKEKELSTIAAQEKEIPNLLKNAFLNKEIGMEASAEIDVLAEKNPYIGLDAGVGYAFGPADGLFIYQGANFYFRPINRDAAFSDLQGSDEFFKRFSIYLGIAQIVTEKDDSFENLFGSSNLLFGAGYRINRAFRINIGNLLHYKKDPNPVVDDKKITLSPTVSLSVDIDLIKALGAVGAALNIK